MFSSDMTMISYFSIIINIIIITYTTFSRVLKSSLSSLVIASSLLSFFYHVIAIFTFFDHTANKIVNRIFA